MLNSEAITRKSVAALQENGLKHAALYCVRIDNVETSNWVNGLALSYRRRS